MFLLSAVDHRKKLIHSANLELKFLKGGLQEKRAEVRLFTLIINSIDYHIVTVSSYSNLF